MRKIFTISWLHQKEFFKTPGAWVLMFILPILFSWIFGGMQVESEQNKPVVNVVVNDGNSTNETFELLKKNNDYKWKKVTLQKAKSNVSEQEVIAAVVIPTDIEKRIKDKKPVLDIILRSKNEGYLALEQYLQGSASLLIRSYQAVEMMDAIALPEVLDAVLMNKGTQVEVLTVQKDGSNMVNVNLMFVGFTMMFMMFGLSGAASTILDERRGGTWERLMITPASRSQIVAGYTLSYFLMGWIQLLTLMTAMNLLFDTSWGKISYIIPFASLVILCVVGFGLMIAGIVKTKQQATAISAVLIVSTCMLGGVYWPIEVVPEFMQKIALAVPQSWAMSGFKEIISGSLHFATLLKDSAMLLGFSMFFFFIGIRGMRSK
ncbi:ABC transporter permease [Neobacillus niacini]|uniref:ABC transporter permease n=1 Tax=Neobacillus niacini TaxID=86668 RepID=UPI002FFF4E8A